ncbi:MAG: tRNA 2-thiouridine(34) synthase MnmA [bacterium]
MSFPLPIPSALESVLRPGTTVLMALSGGVDSSVALALLFHLRCRVHTVTFKNFCYGDSDPAGATPGDKACCSLEAIEDARRIAYRFDCRHQVSDVSARFQEQVITPFVAEYGRARTPNPCIDCNAAVRFPELLRLADLLGLDLVATGHYARISRSDQQWQLRRGLDPEKDQAYFLYRLKAEDLPRIVFPLGWYTKTEVRQAAGTLGLPVAAKPDSQEICFVPEDDRSFLFQASRGSLPGDIVDRKGELLGRHRGLVYYTVGQRRGLGIAAGQPLYVLALDNEHNRLIVGTAEELAVTRLWCDRFVSSAPDFSATGPPRGIAGNWLARIRHRHRGVAVAQWRLDERRLMVALTEPVFGAAPGQALVMYRDDIVLGGGRIVKTA